MIAAALAALAVAAPAPAHAPAQAPQRARTAVLQAAVTYALNYGGTTHIVTAPWRVYACQRGPHRTSCRWTVRVVAGEGSGAPLIVSAQGVVRIAGGRVRLLTYDPEARRSKGI